MESTPPAPRSAPAPPAPIAGEVIGGAYVLETAVPAREAARAPWRARRLGGGGAVTVRLVAADGGAEALRVVDRAMCASGEYHPHTARLLDAGIAPSGAVFLVYDAEPVETLGAALARARLPVAETLRFADVLLTAIASVHYRGALHCGLDADAVLLGPAVGGDGGARAPLLLDLGWRDPRGRSIYDDICAVATLLLEMPAAPLPEPFARLLERALGPQSTGWSSAAEMRAALRALSGRGG